jgi:hypothetical protein
VYSIFRLPRSARNDPTSSEQLTDVFFAHQAPQDDKEGRQWYGKDHP